MFALRSIINHELYSSDSGIEGDYLYNVAGWQTWEEAEVFLHTILKEKFGDHFIDDWDIIDIADEIYYKINDSLKNDSDNKAFYFNNGSYEILNTITGKLVRY